MRSLIFYIITLLLFLTACSTEKPVATLPDPAPDQQIASSAHGLTTTLEKTTYTSATPEIQTILRNENDEDFQYGNFFI